MNEENEVTYDNEEYYYNADENIVENEKKEKKIGILHYLAVIIGGFVALASTPFILLLAGVVFLLVIASGCVTVFLGFGLIITVFTDFNIVTILTGSILFVISLLVFLLLIRISGI